MVREERRLQKKFVRWLVRLMMEPVNIFKMFTVILAIALAVILAVWGRNQFVQRQAEKDFEELAVEVNRLQNQQNDNAITIPDTESTEVAEETESTQTELTGIPQKNLDWTALAEVNSDIYAWIYVPGTSIDYPILQHPTDDSYYLNYNMKGTRGYPGCIYTERQNSKDFTDFDTIVYGHNMRNDSMFATLHNFEDETVFDNYPYVYIYTGDQVLVYEIFAAYTGDDAHILNTNDFTTESGRKQYIDRIFKEGEGSANLREDVAVTTESRLLTLSTCVSGKETNRFLVQAVLVGEGEQ